MCLNLSGVNLLRYSSLKSNLNLPLKFLIFCLSSFLPKDAIEVAVCSKYSLDTIGLTFEKAILWYGISIVLCMGLLLREAFYIRPNTKIRFTMRVNFFLSFRTQSDNVGLCKQRSLITVYQLN